MGEAHAFDPLVDENEIGTEALVGTAQNQRRRAVAAIHQDAELAQGGEIVVGGQVVEIAVDGVGLRRNSADVGPIHEGEFLQMINIEQLAGFGGGKIGALAAEEFQRVPLGAVVAGADRDAASGIPAADGMLDHRRGRDAEIDDGMPASQQAGQQPFADHHAAGARVAADDYRAAGFQERAEGGGEIQYVRGGEPGADHAPQADMGNAQRFRGCGDHL